MQSVSFVQGYKNDSLEKKKKNKVSKLSFHAWIQIYTLENVSPSSVIFSISFAGNHSKPLLKRLHHNHAKCGHKSVIFFSVDLNTYLSWQWTKLKKMAVAMWNMLHFDLVVQTIIIKYKYNCYNHVKYNKNKIIIVEKNRNYILAHYLGLLQYIRCLTLNNFPCQDYDINNRLKTKYPSFDKVFYLCLKNMCCDFNVKCGINTIILKDKMNVFNLEILELSNIGRGKNWGENKSFSKISKEMLKETNTDRKEKNRLRREQRRQRAMIQWMIKMVMLINNYDPTFDI